MNRQKKFRSAALLTVFFFASTAIAFPLYDLPTTTMSQLAGFLFEPEAQTSAVGLATVVINEIDYDQVGTDDNEFIELKNTSLVAVDLDGYTVELVNGTGGGAAIYQTITLPSFNLASGDYYVICANPGLNCDLDVTPNTDLIQNRRS